MQEIQLWILRKRNLHQHRSLEAVNVNVKRRVVVGAKIIFGVRKTLLKILARLVAEENDFRFRSALHRDVYESLYVARDGEIGVDVCFRGRVHEVDFRVILILRLGQVEGELIIDCEFVETGSV